MSSRLSIEEVTRPGIPNLSSVGQMTILFYIRITDTQEDEVVKVLKQCLFHILSSQKRLGIGLIRTIYIERWAYDLIENDIFAL